ncbi:hypothetical protein HanRHA438_Chr02g0095561 [Helianthus annuus]|nr:hypothetical protein HanRHA438_Chr02g0095561 [Helianthus annuus]
MSSDKGPVSWLPEALNSDNDKDVHPDRLFRKSGKLTRTEFLSKTNFVRLHRFPRYFGIPSNLF